ncbi:MAG: hypothetical protein ACJA01_002442 [Saprospiraceae bacterium]|jgi:hypothetical protein
MSIKTQYVLKEISIAPLITFRVLFGIIMAISIFRFAAYGWIHELYIDPKFFFTYYGFEWVKPLGEIATYLVFVMMFMSAIGIALGSFYRISTIAFFLSFTYVELIDKTNYLNHYYFVSVIAFILIWLPAHRNNSLDVIFNRVSKISMVPAWTINAIKLQLVIVYFYAGLAKLNYYWLVEGMPLKLWLPAKSHIPIIGALLQYKWTAYLFSWGGAIYDLTIPWLLLNKRTRVLAFIGVVVFHLLTALLFQIGMFPYIMILSACIFFDAKWHLRVHSGLSNLFPKQMTEQENMNPHNYQKDTFATYGKTTFYLFFFIQLLLPFRFLNYPGDLFWKEQGYRFSWRVMLMEKAGYTTFRVEDESGKQEWVQNYDYLTPQQEKMMSTQPDMILQFAHHLRDVYSDRDFIKPRVYCDSKASLNGRRSQTLIDPSVNLSEVRDNFNNKNWILDFER